MRLFFALWPPAVTAEALAEWARGFGGRAVAAPKIHLTLAFLGDAEPGRAAAAARAMHGERHALPLEEAGYWRHNRIIWVGPRATPPRLAALVERLHAALREGGFVLEARPFAAHVTLVRKARPPRFPPLPQLAWPVDQFALVQSVQGEYRTLETFQLR
jgi:2'-5' RNA ligase